METWSAIEVTSVIRFLRLKKRSQAEIRRQLVKVHGRSVMSRKRLKFWFVELDKVRTDVRGEQRLGLSKHVHHRVIGKPYLQPRLGTK
ncbi:hypothetical protein AVEN_42788-1 [Araneus ventricosus]|uniref:Mos1 transposase HTH domain-containing protein n=1 Tax=Araneus ventricosus TaxID=182803 RepID=A0A4Y2AEF9_ARAVE|nr:hypothetical protein AVEN_42788-1 [Araneus ventricosus]